MSAFEITTLFESGRGGYRTYRIPALVVSGDGAVLAFCEGRRDDASDFGKIDIVLRRSFDNGKTWDEPRIVVSDGEQTCGNPCPVLDRRTGVVWLPFCKNNQQVFVTKSSDDGSTWSPPIEITDDAKDPAWSYIGTGPGHSIQLESGRLLIPSWCDESPGPVKDGPSSDWNGGKVQSSYMIYSDDHGASWTYGDKLDHDLSDECEAVETSDGGVYASLRSRQAKQQRGYSLSRDGGDTWSEIRFDENLPEPPCQAGLACVGSADGRRVYLISHPARTDRRGRLTVRASFDECESWSSSRLIYKGQASYSDLAAVDGGKVLCLYECDTASRMVLARFDIAWIKDGQSEQFECKCR